MRLTLRCISSLLNITTLNILICVLQVRNVISKGIPVIASAGNENKNADTSSPARVREVITVGATTIEDKFASFSNFGKAVDVLAPGELVISAGIQSDTAAAIRNGTSMAT